MTFHERLDYDPSTKTISLATRSDRRKPEAVTKIWEVDPQRQIIELLKDIRLCLNKLVDRDPPYHSGPRTVEVARTPPPAPLTEPELPDPES